MRLLARACIALGVLIGGLAIHVDTAAPAHAGWRDVVHSMEADYVVRPSGDVDVTQRIEYEFGARGRPGIELDIPAREPWDSSRDVVYAVSDVVVSSPTGAATDVSQRTVQEHGTGRTRLRIGDPSRPADRTETYLIRYTIRSATQSQPGFDEFVWDVSAAGPGAPVEKVEVSVSAPGGVQGARCSLDEEDEAPCPGATVSSDGRGYYQTSSLGPDDTFRVAALLIPGAVEPGPELVARAEPVRRSLLIGGLAMVASTLITSALVWREIRRSQGIARVARPRRHVPDDRVLLEPPDISPAEASLLVDGVWGARHTAATLMDLAVRGVVDIGPAVAGEATIAVRDPGRVRRGYESALLARLFGHPKSGATITLGPRRPIPDVHAALRRAVCCTVTEAKWFPRRRALLTAPTLFGLLLAVGTVLALSGFALSGVASVQVGWAVVGVLALLPVAIGVLWMVSWRRWALPTEQGAKVSERVRLHREALAALEADQVEPGTSMLTESLPWSVSVDDTERWASIMQEAITLGRVSDEMPPWWRGATFSPFAVIGVVRALELAATGPQGAFLQGQAQGRT